MWPTAPPDCLPLAELGPCPRVLSQQDEVRGLDRVTLEYLRLAGLALACIGVCGKCRLPLYAWWLYLHEMISAIDAVWRFFDLRVRMLLA
jgi:hypothetical protein